MLCPAEKHLGATLGDIVVAKIPSVDTTGVDVITRWGLFGPVKNFFPGPRVLQDNFDIIVDRGGAATTEV